jgi:hypothetical protein
MLMQKCYIYVLGPLYDFRCAFQERGIMHFRKGALIPSFGVGLGWADPQKKGSKIAIPNINGTRQCNS